jgi:hypothetical protein
MTTPAFDALRRYAIARTLLTPTTLPRAIRRLGFVQADPIRAPARAQDLTLRHRVEVATAAGQLELAYLPPYSPELNPDEQVWKSVKAHVAKKVPTDKSHMRELILEAFGHLVRAAHVVLGFFRHPECRYAMA